MVVKMSSEDNESCRVDGCDGEPRWRWWNGKGAFAGYCDEHAREQLDEEDRCPITRREDVSDGYVLPAGIQPHDTSFPTIRTKDAFDTYLETDGEMPRQCDVAWCSKTRKQCGHDGDAKLRADGGTNSVSEGGTERSDPTENPHACSVCGVYLGSFPNKEYCDGCAREIGAKPPMQRCMACGRDAPQEQMETIDVSPPDEYYPEIEYLCPSCSGGDCNGN